uniref:Uncharacterized protein n=1 Tax=Oryza glumipatula TaxID=40148 RepID=A0A0D9ZGR4_9ORYZ
MHLFIVVLLAARVAHGSTGASPAICFWKKALPDPLPEALMAAVERGGSRVLHVLDPGFPVASHRLGQQQVAEHGVLVEHVVAQQGPSPKINPADGGATECDDLTLVVQWKSTSLGVWGMGSNLPPSHGVVDGGHEASDDVVGPAGAADNGDLLVAEGGCAGSAAAGARRRRPCRRSSRRI